MLCSSSSSESECSPWQRLLHGHGGWGLQNPWTCCHTSSVIMVSLTGMGKNQAQKVGTDVHIYHVAFLVALSCQFEPVLGAAKSSRSKSSLSSVSQYAGKEERANSWLEVRLLPHHDSHSFPKAGLISLQTLSWQNCLEKISGPTWQHPGAWQRQLSPWWHHPNGTTLLSACLRCLTYISVDREPVASSYVPGK